jgi:hypothetical protein
MKRNLAPTKLCDLPKIVDPVTMICMVVRNDHPIDFDRSGCKQLLAKVRTAVNQQRLATAFDQDRGARSPVSRLIRIAVAPIVADPWNPG